MATLHRAWVVTAADFNGKDFDGSPVETLFPKPEDQSIDQVAPWFQEAIKSGKILVEARGCTDYAWFGVKDDYHNVHWAGPGDVIARIQLGDLIVIPKPMVKHMKRLFRHEGVSLDIGSFVLAQADLKMFHGEFRLLPL